MIFVSDLKVAKNFYNKKLGIGVKSDLADQLNILIMESNNVIFTLHGGFKDRKHDNSRKIAIAFSVKDIKAAVHRLKIMKIKLIGEIEETPVHWFQAFEDPFGNMIEIGQYK